MEGPLDDHSDFLSYSTMRSSSSCELPPPKRFTNGSVSARLSADHQLCCAASIIGVNEGRRRIGEGIEKAHHIIDDSLDRAHLIIDDGLERARRAKAKLQQSISDALASAQRQGLIAYTDLPDPWKVNPHIRKGYRFSETAFECVRSTLTISNETFNIWSHALGFLAIVVIAFYLYPTHPLFPLHSRSDIFVAGVFFFAACKCLVCSTMWHTMNSIAEQNVMERFACVDYTGISLLIAASIMTTEYTAFYCEPFSRWTYMCSTAFLGVLGVIIPWHPNFNRADMRWARVAFYVTLGLTGLSPVIQLNITRGPEWSYYFYAPVMKSVAVYVAGAMIYACQVPERWFPGMFDYVGGSHNVWHVCVLAGILFHYVAMQRFFEGAFDRAAQGCSTL